MRTAFAILFSSLLLWMQAVAASSPHLVLQPASCPCCDCNRSCCPPRSAETRPASPVAARPVAEEKTPAPGRQPPAPAYARHLTSASAFQPPNLPSARPNFGLLLSPHQRNCILLI